MKFLSQNTGTARQYNQVWDDLKAAGHEHRRGIISHVGFAKPGAWCVVDAWESQEAFDAFTETLTKGEHIALFLLLKNCQFPFCVNRFPDTVNKANCKSRSLWYYELPLSNIIHR